MTTLTKLILVIGATGQQGGAVARALMNKGPQIRVMTNTRKSSRTREGGRRSGQRRPDEPGPLAGGIAWDLWSVCHVHSVEAGMDAEVRQGAPLAERANKPGWCMMSIRPWAALTVIRESRI